MALKFIINVPVADVKKNPDFVLPQDYSHQDIRETQLLFGEKIEILNQRGDWYKIAALEQIFFDDKKGWQPIVGWVAKHEIKKVNYFEDLNYVVCDKSSLSYGTLLPYKDTAARSIPKMPCRKLIAEDAKLFLDSPYLWGGRSLYTGSSISSVDCSGLINLLYRAQGISVPRNAHDQYLKSKPVTQLQIADPLFLVKENRVVHVILKLDNKTFIESPETGKKIRLLHWGNEIWENKGKIHFFDRPNSYVYYTGTFLAVKRGIR